MCFANGIKRLSYTVKPSLKATTQNGGLLWEVVYYMNPTTVGFVQKEVQTLYVSKENIIACGNFKVNVMYMKFISNRSSD